MCYHYFINDFMKGTFKSFISKYNFNKDINELIHNLIRNRTFYLKYKVVLEVFLMNRKECERTAWESWV